MMAEILYDDALPLFAARIRNLLGEAALIDNLILRDSEGRLTFVRLDPTADETTLAALRGEAAVLAPYLDPQPVATPADLFDDSLNDPALGVIERIEHPAFSGFVRVVERRIAGHDWLRRPMPPQDGVPPVIVFASHKGGVGRSTALAVTAAHLAATGRNALVIDLALEAPGLGGMLLPADQLPEFGLLDFYVESGLRPIDRAFLDRMIAPSPLTSGRGLVHVAPAVGRRSEAYPANLLGKLSRAYLEAIPSDPTAAPRGFLDRTRTLIAELAGMGRYDAILVDARAGLNETTAATLLGLGGWSLLFGIDTPQTFHGYRYLLAFLGRYRPAVGDTGEDWRGRLRLVHAKAAANPDSWTHFHDQAYDLCAETLYDEVGGDDDTAFNFDRHDAAAPHKAWHILADTTYAEFDPLSRPEVLGTEVFRRTFADLLDGIDRLLETARNV